MYTCTSMTLNINYKENILSAELLEGFQRFGAATSKFQESDKPETSEIEQDIFL